LRLDSARAPPPRRCVVAITSRRRIHLDGSGAIERKASTWRSPRRHVGGRADAHHPGTSLADQAFPVFRYRHGNEQHLAIGRCSRQDPIEGGHGWLGAAALRSRAWPPARRWMATLDVASVWPLADHTFPAPEGASRFSLPATLSSASPARSACLTPGEFCFVAGGCPGSRWRCRQLSRSRLADHVACADPAGFQFRCRSAGPELTTEASCWLAC